MSIVDYSMEGPRELHHAMLECEMLRESCIKVLEEVAKYLKTDKAPPEVEKSGKEEEVDSKVKELVKENSSKEEIIAKDNLGFVGAQVEESESKAKELMPMTYNTVMKELLEVRSGSWNQVQGSTIKQTQMGMGAKDQEEEKLKQKEQIRCSGGLDPGEAIKDKEEQFALKAQVERFVAKDKEVGCAKDWEEVNVAKDWEEERLDIKDWEEEWLAIKDVKEVKQKPREAMDSLGCCSCSTIPR